MKCKNCKEYIPMPDYRDGHMGNCHGIVVNENKCDCDKYSSFAEIVRCKDCIHDGLSECPICYIENHTLQFINHDGNFFCAKGEKEENANE